MDDRETYIRVGGIDFRADHCRHVTDDRGSGIDLGGLSAEDLRRLGYETTEREPNK